MVLIQTKSGILRKGLLICGIIAIPVYAITDMLAGVLYPGYSFTDQAVSELFAIGAPTSGLVVPLFTVYSLLILAFGIGVWISAGTKGSLRFMSLMIFANAVNGLLLWNLFPMHMRGEEMTSIDLVHATLAATGGIFGALAIGFGAVAFGRRFRFYSIGTIAMMFVPTLLVFSFVPQVGANQSSPWMGLLERAAFFVYMQWQIVMALILLRSERMMALKASGKIGVY